MAKRKVVLTGASGYIAQRMLAALQARYDLRLLDARPTTRDGQAVPGLQVVDLTDPDRDAYRRHFTGADAVVHCAFVSAPGLDATTVLDNSEPKFRAEHANVGMAYNVYQTALEEGVRRVVVTSSCRAADFYERLIWADKWDVVTPEMLPISDNFYGWAKAAYELLGFVFATGQGLPRRLEVVQIRIGGPRDTADLEQCRPGEIKKMRRGWTPQPKRSGAALHQEHRGAEYRERARRPVPDLLRHQRQYPPLLEHRQRAARDRLRARGRQPGHLRPAHRRAQPERLTARRRLGTLTFRRQRRDLNSGIVGRRAKR